MTRVGDRAADAAEERMLDALLPARHRCGGIGSSRPARRRRGRDTRQKFRKMLREGALDDREIEIEVRARARRCRDHGAARHGGHDPPAPGHVPEHGAGPDAPRASSR